MDAAEFLKHLKRMCDSMNGSCTGFPVYDDCNFGAVGGVFECGKKVDEYIAAVAKWAKEHPVKTRQSEFLKMFPNASIGYNGTLVICPSQADTKAIVGCVRSERNCDKCKRDFWLKEIE